MKNLLIGLVLAGLGAWGLVTWWNVFGLVMRGIIPFSLLVLGLVAIFAGYRKGAQVSRSETSSAVKEGGNGARPSTPEPDLVADLGDPAAKSTSVMS